MVGDVMLAGYTLTADEWRSLDAVTRDELVGAVAGDVEVDLSPDDDPRAPQLLV